MAKWNPLNGPHIGTFGTAAVKDRRPKDISLRLPCQERIAEDLEAARILLASGTAKGVYR
jgi:hypothetical protein